MADPIAQLPRGSRSFTGRQSVRWGLPLLVALLAGSNLLLAQQPAGQLAGVVRDANGAPVVGAVLALDANTTSQRLTRSDSAGHFRFERVARGPHELAVAMAGYRTEVRHIDMPDGALDISIVLQDIVSMIDTMRIEARRTGIFGTVIAREGFRPLANADVYVVGIPQPKVTGGRWAVRVRAGGPRLAGGLRDPKGVRAADAIRAGAS
ncbi:MAG TPA: carboxypeptidase-like regulatory domain-containing protein [Gemmatimonadaceae bacterium]